MSEEHVELVRRFLDAYVAADYERAAALLHADAQWHNTPSFPGPQAVYGPEAIRQFWREMFGAFAGSWRSGSGMETEKITDYDDVVVAEVHGWGAGKSSAARFDRRWAHAFRQKDRKILRIDTYGSYNRALEVLGLEHRPPTS
jgi:ketosteroid isomerase-like protein